MNTTPFNLTRIRAGICSALFLLTACKGEPGTVSAESAPGNTSEGAVAAAPAHGETHQDGIAFRESRSGEVFESYIELKKALVASNAESASLAAGVMAELLGDSQPGLKEALTVISGSSDLEEIRAGFAALNPLLEPYLREELANGTIYKQFCPMAFNNAGGYWFSDSDEILNPYFGDAMLKCGKVDDRLTAL